MRRPADPSAARAVPCHTDMPGIRVCVDRRQYWRSGLEGSARAAEQLPGTFLHCWPLWLVRRSSSPRRSCAANLLWPD